MTDATFALAIPHLPTDAARAANMVALRRWLEVDPKAGHDTPDSRGIAYREFTDKAPWAERSIGRWKWALQSGADYFLQLEDDVHGSPVFWAALRAMRGTWPDDIIVLAATHSMGWIVANQGRRSYITPKLLGWAFCLPGHWLPPLIAFAEQDNRLAQYSKKENACEDTFLADTLFRHGGIFRHPVPTIVDHLHAKSTNGWDHICNSQASVTWREFSPADLTTPVWWNTATTYLPLEAPARVETVTGMCGWCFDEQVAFMSAKTKAGLCRTCVVKIAAQAIAPGMSIPGKTP